MNRLWVRLSLGFSGMVLAAVFIVALAGILVAWSDRRERARNLDQEMDNLVVALVAHYRQEQSWRGSEALLAETQARARFERRIDRDVAFVLANAQREIVYHFRPERIGQPVGQLRAREIRPIRLDGEIIGYLGAINFLNQTADRSAGQNGAESTLRRFDGPPDFVLLLGGVLLSVAAVAGISGVIFGGLMSRSLTAPLSNLAEAARAIGRRDLSRRVEEKGSAEMVAVARAFNEMAGELEEAERLRRNLLADVAHELRTPLTVLQGNLRAMLDEVYPMDKREVTRLYDQTRLLGRLIKDLHELAQAEAHQLPLNLQKTDLSSIIEAISETFNPIAEAKGVRLTTTLPPDLPSIRVDPARLAQVLNNLLNNALRHTPSGGAITIQAERLPETIALHLSDSGEGIPAEHLPHIFDRFYRTDPARSRDRGGAGLGLAIARAIIEAHAGRIAVTSPGLLGSGSTFTIRLPLQMAQELA